jgi:hypothetical protein
VRYSHILKLEQKGKAFIYVLRNETFFLELCTFLFGIMCDGLHIHNIGAGLQRSSHILPRNAHRKANAFCSAPCKIPTGFIDGLSNHFVLGEVTMCYK